MRTCFWLAALALPALLAPLPCPAQLAAQEPVGLPPPTVLGDGDPAVLEVTVTAAATRPGALVIPMPPAEDASEPERILHYFCRAWKDWDFKAMYGAMASDYRSDVPYRRFEALFKGDIETNGGLLDESIAAEPGGSGAAAVRLRVVLRYRNAHAAPRTVVALAVREGADGWRLAESGLIPLDLDDL